MSDAHPVQRLQPSLHAVNDIEELLFGEVLASHAHLLYVLPQRLWHELVKQTHTQVVLGLLDLELMQADYFLYVLPTFLQVMLVRFWSCSSTFLASPGLSSSFFSMRANCLP